MPCTMREFGSRPSTLCPRQTTPFRVGWPLMRKRSAWIETMVLRAAGTSCCRAIAPDVTKAVSTVSMGSADCRGDIRMVATSYLSFLPALNPARARDTVAAVVRRAGPPVCRKPVRADILGDRSRISMGRATQEAKAMTQTPSKTQILLARLAVGLIVAFAVLGFAVYGFSAEVRQRIWQNLLDRPSGPMTFRFIPPAHHGVDRRMAGRREGRPDAGALPISGRCSRNPAKVGGRLHEGLIATARILLLGLVDGRDLPGHRVRDVPPRRGGDHLDPARVRPLPAAARPDHARGGLVARPPIGERRSVRTVRT